MVAFDTLLKISVAGGNIPASQGIGAGMACFIGINHSVGLPQASVNQRIENVTEEATLYRQFSHVTLHHDVSAEIGKRH